MAIKHVDPISRIEGHLGVDLTLNAAGDSVVAADVHGNLWRGFENFLVGREPNDAITFVQRICGVCPVPHGTTSTFAVESVVGYNSNFCTFKWNGTPGTAGVPLKALHIRNLILASEFLMSSMTHFYHLAAPSYVQGPPMAPWTPYFADGYYHAKLRHGTKTIPVQTGGFSADLWSAVITQYVKALRIRRLTFEAGALFAGRMPMSSALIAGGVPESYNEDLTNKCNLFNTLTTEVAKFIVKEYVPLVLALGALYPQFENTANLGSGWGAGLGNFLAWGGFPQDDDTVAVKGGYKLAADATPTVFFAGKGDSTTASALVKSSLKEDTARSRYVANAASGYAAGQTAAYPGDVSRTEPIRSDANKYSWMKAPRWNGNAMEVGPLARLVVNSQYPVDGSLLALGVPGYTAYAKAFNAGVGSGIAGTLEYPAGTFNGIDPKMVNADLAVALVREGLATVHLPDGTAVTDEATIVANYSSAIITGTVAGYILNLKGGLSTMDRLRARAIESLVLVQSMIGTVSKAGADLTFATAGSWIGKLTAMANNPAEKTFNFRATPTTQVSGFGATEAPRGALAHFITINGGKISKYQCVVPTTWNGSPKDAGANPGAIEKAIMGSGYNTHGQSTFTNQAGNPVNTESGVEALRIAQSFDPCIACAVH